MSLSINFERKAKLFQVNKNTGFHFPFLSAPMQVAESPHPDSSKRLSQDTHLEAVISQDTEIDDAQVTNRE